MRNMSFATHSSAQSECKSGLLRDANFEAIPSLSRTHSDAVSHSVRKLIKLAPRLARTRWMKRPSGIDDWADESRRIVIMGEAAHPWFVSTLSLKSLKYELTCRQPGGAYGPSVAVEDAVVFSGLFAHIQWAEQIPVLLSAYQEIRESRCNEILNEDIAAARMVWLPPGPQRDARNADMAKGNDQTDENTLRQTLDSFSSVFCYDARDAVEEWWVNWGRFDESARRQSTILS